MSMGELLVIFLVTLLVFGPKKLPMLATHLGIWIRKLNQLKVQSSLLWQQQVKELQLQENMRKAKDAEEQHKMEFK